MRLTKIVVDIWYWIGLWLLIILWLMCTPAHAELNRIGDFDFNAEGLTADQFTGRTVVAASRDTDDIWSLYFAKNGAVAVTAIHVAAESDSTTETATSSNSTTKEKDAIPKKGFRAFIGKWSQPEKDIICLTSGDKNPVEELGCYFAGKNGRGTDWKEMLKNKSGQYKPANRKEHRGEYQIVYSFAGDVSSQLTKRIAPVRDKLADLQGWRGHIVVGRTLKDREAWLAIYRADGSLIFIYGSGRRFEGSYEIKKDTICMDFPESPVASGCRGPKAQESKIVWAAAKTGAFISEVLFLLPITEGDAAKNGESITTADEESDLDDSSENKSGKPQPKTVAGKRDFALPKGECYAVLGSRKTLAGVRKLIKKSKHPNPDVFVTQKGSYSISAFNDFAGRKMTKKLIKELITAGLLPKKTSCESGRQFVYQVGNWAKMSDKQVKKAIKSQ